MKSKLKNLINKYWVIPVSLLLLLPVASIGSLLLYFTISLTGIEWFGFLFSYGISGIIISLPIIVKVWKSDKIKKGVKAIIIILTVLLFSVISCMLFWYKKLP